MSASPTNSPARLACLLLALGTGACLPNSSPPTTHPSGPTTQTLKWDQYMLFLFAESEGDPRLDQQRRALGPEISSFEKRSLRYVEVVGTDPLRDSLDVPLTGFHLLLLNRANKPLLVKNDVTQLSEILNALPTK